ncbi:MmgE/PrpD family protein [Psychromarinibacter halotolerans]|uniref:MmgE/PrpD family protein n=1 Tax=Psychromarinibacter halotolerans TaxID=1775175 RepID=A0ABV7GN06_9RHOB|nr:MmgE/PrpD family protein [Psychromarinibacter halotolerans]MDF0596593.1 MmgE/PrpD family protein [Psychromarinibacter halotolerans]
MTKPDGLTARLGRFVAETSPGDIPERVRERARVSLLHNLCMARAGRGRYGSADAYARRFHAVPAEATLLSGGARVTAEAAAFANGSLFHARSQDDTHPGSTSHPGAPVMAAALAVAEAEGATGAQFLDAVILGYEALCRAGRDFDELVTKRGFRAAAVIGGFGSAAAAARLMRLDAEQTGHALAFSAHQAGGLAQVWVEGTDEFPMQLGLAAHAGLRSARLASLGMTAARSMLEGAKGFYATYAGADAAPVEALHGLGEAWQFDEVTVKAFPACAILQGPLGALQGLLDTIGLARIDRIDLSLSPYEAGYPGVDNAGPAFAGPTAAKMSAQFCLGVMALDERLRLSDLSRTTEPEIAAMAERITVHPDPAVEPRLCRVRVTLDDCRVLEVEVNEPVGRPDFDAMARFAQQLAPEMDLSEAGVSRLADEVRAIDRAPDMTGLLAACLQK